MTAWLERLEHYERIGFREIPGPGSNDHIVGWAHSLGATWVKGDDTPWCGFCMGGIFRETGLEHVVPKGPGAAISWLNCGVPCPPKVGAIAIFPREGGGNHVTCIKRIEGTVAWCIGGNQGDAIKTSPFELSAAKGFRWPIAPLVPTESRIATAASRQQRDGAIATATGAPTATLPAPTGLRESATSWAAELTWFQGVAGKAVDFTAFMVGNWRVVAGAVVLFLLVRMTWDSRMIREWRSEDHEKGYTQ